MNINQNRLRNRYSKCSINIQTSWDKIENELENYFPRIDNLFEQYTLHNKNHCLALESILDWIVPDETLDSLNDYEVFCLIVSLWCHDIGMGATDSEIKDFCEARCRNIPDENKKMDFVRDNHASISKYIVIKLINNLDDPNCLGLANICGDIVESHTLKNLEDMELKVPVAHQNNWVHQLFIAILVRIADILHCTIDRAPFKLMVALNINNPESLKHWKQAQAIPGIGYEADTKRITLRIETDDIIAYKWSKVYFNTIKNELDYCAAITMKRGLTLSYTLKTYDIQIIEKTPFIGGLTEVTIDAPAAIYTLTGKHLYEDQSIVIRELLQNSLDACRIRSFYDQDYQPNIHIHYNSENKEIFFKDNGIGMNLEDIKDGLLRSCSSKFRHAIIDEHLISKFGIGFLSVFLVADKIEIKTRKFNESENSGLRIILRQPSMPVSITESSKIPIGTSITLFLKNELTFSKENVSQWYPYLTDVELEFNYNSEKIEKEVDQNGKCSEGEIVSQEFTIDDDDFFLSLNPKTLLIDSNAYPCGSSFQNINQSHPFKVFELPTLEKRIFLNSVPIIKMYGAFPDFQAGNNDQYFFQKAFIPFLLNIKKPGYLELNLQRNMFIKSKSNDKYFEKIDDSIAELILRYVEWLKSKANYQSTFISRLILEFSLDIKYENAQLPFFNLNNQPVKSTIKDKMKSVLSEMELIYLNEDGKEYKRCFVRSINSKYPTIFFPKQFIDQIPNRKDFIGQLFTKLKKHFKGINIVINCEYIINNSNIGDLLVSYAKSMALYDLYDLGIEFPPIPVYSYSESLQFSNTGEHIVDLYGSDKLICAYVVNHALSGFQSGSAGYDLFINKKVLSRYKDIEKSYWQKQGNQSYWFNGKPDKFLHDFLKKFEIPEKYLNEKYIHPCIGKK